MREKSLLMVVLIGFVVFFMGCAGEEPSKGEVGTPEATMTETPKTTMTEKPTVTATPESKFDKNELAERIDEEINEEYVNYLGNIYMNYKEDMLFISYLSYMAGEDVKVYGQSLSVMEIINAYIVERDLEIKTTKFRITSEIRSMMEDDGKIVEYTFTIERTEMQKFLNGTWGFSEWQEMTEKTVGE